MWTVTRSMIFRLLGVFLCLLSLRKRSVRGSILIRCVRLRINCGRRFPLVTRELSFRWRSSRASRLLFSNWFVSFLVSWLRLVNQFREVICGFVEKSFCKKVGGAVFCSSTSSCDGSGCWEYMDCADGGWGFALCLFCGLIGFSVRHSTGRVIAWECGSA